MERSARPNKLRNSQPIQSLLRQAQLPQWVIYRWLTLRDLLLLRGYYQFFLLIFHYENWFERESHENVCIKWRSKVDLHWRNTSMSSCIILSDSFNFFLRNFSWSLQKASASSIIFSDVFDLNSLSLRENSLSHKEHLIFFGLRRPWFSYKWLQNKIQRSGRVNRIH